MQPSNIIYKVCLATYICLIVFSFLKYKIQIIFQVLRLRHIDACGICCQDLTLDRITPVLSIQLSATCQNIERKKPSLGYASNRECFNELVDKILFNQQTIMIIKINKRLLNKHVHYYFFVRKFVYIFIL